MGRVPRAQLVQARGTFLGSTLEALREEQLDFVAAVVGFEGLLGYEAHGEIGTKSRGPAT
jgi:hypothetical protein